LRRRWHDDGKPVVGKAYEKFALAASVDGALKYVHPSGEPRDPYNYPVQRPYLKSYPEIGLNSRSGTPTASTRPSSASPARSRREVSPR
jgi:hypothetical protein